jgi:aminoglycoside 6'-N-acetyltransferase
MTFAGRSYPTQLEIEGGIRLRLSTPKDADDVLAWTSDPAVYVWWEGRPLERAEVEAKYTGARLPKVVAYIIELNEQPAGFIQAWQQTDQQGLDMFLKPSAQGQGLGSAVARALASSLSRHGWDRITVDPAIDNRQAVRAWTKAGFVTTGEFGEEGGRKTQLMVFQS